MDSEEFDEIDMILMRAKDPTVEFKGGPVPAMTTMLFRVCNQDAEKFDEASRIIRLIVQEALRDGR